jgi:hypothetical protein
MMVLQALGPSTAKWVINRAIVHLGYRRLLQGNTLRPWMGLSQAAD